LRRALHAGQDLPSQAGTQGEAGQGLGLALAQEHLQRMGGRLSLMERDGGGLLARVTLEAA
jgi:signal transduction histidine kinase